MKLRRLMIGSTVILALSWAFSASPAAARKQKDKDSAAAAAKTTSSGTPVNLNTATSQELEDLPGVGKATAKKIIAARPYSSVSDLSKAGVSAKVIERLTPLVTVSGSPAAPAAARPVAPAAAPPLPKAAAPAAASAPAASAPAPPAKGMVWVNEETKVFHHEGSRWYGKTKKGKYMTEADALQAGYRAAKTREKKP